MKLSKTIIAACVTTLFASAAAQAATFDEEGWKKTKSYGDVTVAEDSSDAWGPWAGFVEPAAGGPTISPLAFLGGGNGGFYRNQPGTNQTPATPDTPVTPEQPEQPPIVNSCQGVSACGYALFSSTKKVENQKKILGIPYWVEDKKQGDTTSRQVSEIDANLSGGSPFYTFSWTLDQLGELEFSPMRPSSLGTVQGVFLNQAHTAFIATTFDPFDNQSSFMTGFRKLSDLNDLMGKGAFSEAARDADNAIAIGQFESKLIEYLDGNKQRVTTTTSGVYVAGTPTTVPQLQNLNLLTATYRGGSYDGSKQGVVTIDVNFSTASWTGNWTKNNGYNFSVTEGNGSINGAVLSGVVNSGGYAGSVQGKFYGNQAGTIAGASSVTNTQKATTQNALFVVNRVASAPANPSAPQ